MSYDSDERSISQNRPIDLYTIATPTVIYHITSYPVNITFGGNTYLALAMDRSTVEISQDQTGREMVVYLPISHPLVQSFCASGIPEQSITVTLSRLQSVSSQAQQIRTGFLQGISIKGQVASLRVPSPSDDAFKISLPVIAAQPTCNHVLGDAGCAPNPGGAFPIGSTDPFSGGPDITTVDRNVSTTIATLPGGNVLTVASIGANPNGWASFGKLTHIPTGQTRYIVDQTSTTITLIAPIVGAAVGDAVQVQIGCDHTIATCGFKFLNRPNFGGHPQMNPLVNPWAPNGLGIIQQV